MKLNSDERLSEATTQTSSGKTQQDVASVLLYHPHHRCGIRLLWAFRQDTRRQDQVSSREGYKKLRLARGNNTNKKFRTENLNL
jgi:hypothetical protein